ncbi:MAG: carboxymuconolactone decarboxylase family protein, partial [Candidatus Bathyarchaeota archaeon]|nr:carboxymuconolactone decarboxylase family protein [Candidatus Bathyarchaeota archaeon]
IRCVQVGVSDQEFFEALNVALVVGGSIVIPHLRRAVDMLDQCRKKQSKGQSIKI